MSCTPCGASSDHDTHNSKHIAGSGMAPSPQHCRSCLTVGARVLRVEGPAAVDGHRGDLDNLPNHFARGTELLSHPCLRARCEGLTSRVRAPELYPAGGFDEGGFESTVLSLDGHHEIRER